MKVRFAHALSALITAATLFLGCGADTPTIVTACPASSEATEIDTWRDRAILIPRTSLGQLISSDLWQGIEPTMSRSEIETLLATYLRSRQSYWSEFETPLGRLRWSLDREASGGDVVQIPRIYLDPQNLSLKDVFSADVLECLQRAAPRAKEFVVRRSSGRSQPTTLVVDGLRVQQVIWRQTKV
jgi:hypothetical protein